MYIIRHKKYKTFYGKKISVNIENALIYKTYRNADKIRNERKNPDNWEIIEIIRK